MVARQILVLQVGVRVPVRQQNVLRVGIFIIQGRLGRLFRILHIYLGW